MHVIAHERAHVQQALALVDDKNPTVLEASPTKAPLNSRPN
jgi:hypothetical protein